MVLNRLNRLNIFNRLNHPEVTSWREVMEMELGSSAGSFIRLFSSDLFSNTAGRFSAVHSPKIEGDSPARRSVPKLLAAELAGVGHRRANSKKQSPLISAEKTVNGASFIS